MLFAGMLRSFWTRDRQQEMSLQGSRTEHHSWPDAEKASVAKSRLLSLEFLGEAVQVGDGEQTLAPCFQRLWRGENSCRLACWLLMLSRAVGSIQYLKKGCQSSTNVFSHHGKCTQSMFWSHSHIWPPVLEPMPAESSSFPIFSLLI